MVNFEKYLKYERQLAGTTITYYLSFINEFKTFLKEELAGATREDIREFIMHLQERGLRKASIANYIIAFRSYFNWMADLTRDKQIIEMSFFLSKIIKTRRDRSISIVPSIEEVLKLRKTMEAYKQATSFQIQSPLYKTILREIAMIELLITTGIRSKELRSLRFCDIDLYKKIILVRVGKGGQQRISLFNESAECALKEYFGNNNFCADDLVFPLKQGNVLNYILKKWAKKANINEKIHAHSFRHYFITESQRQGVPVEFVAEQVGHRNLNTTRAYSHFNIEFLREKYQACKI